MALPKIGNIRRGAVKSMFTDEKLIFEWVDSDYLWDIQMQMSRKQLDI